MQFDNQLLTNIRREADGIIVAKLWPLSTSFIPLVTHGRKGNSLQEAACCRICKLYPPQAFGRGVQGRLGEILRPLLFFMALKANVYIDGFNFYYGCIKKTPYRWLNLSLFCQRMLPKNEIHRIRYFTALVTPRLGDPDQRTRQDTYLRALRTIPNLSIHLGSFLSNKVWMMRADGSGKVQVLKTEEKGSDVNLASYLLIDAYSSDCDIAVIVSNDSDLIFPIEHIKKHLGKMIGILNPHPSPSRELYALASFYKPIRHKALASSLFANELIDFHGKFHKPTSW